MVKSHRKREKMQIIVSFQCEANFRLTWCFGSIQEFAARCHGTHTNVQCIFSVPSHPYYLDAIDGKSFGNFFIKTIPLFGISYNRSHWWNHYHKCAIIVCENIALESKRAAKPKRERNWEMKRKSRERDGEMERERESERCAKSTLYANIERSQFIPTTFVFIPKHWRCMSICRSIEMMMFMFHFQLLCARFRLVE